MQGSPTLETRPQGSFRHGEQGFFGVQVKEEGGFPGRPGYAVPAGGAHRTVAAAGGTPHATMALQPKMSSEELGGFQGISLADSLEVGDSNLPQPALTVLDGDMYGSPLASSGAMGGSKNQRGKRSQVWRACLPCRKLKIRCDEERPCQRCVEKGVADSCVSWDNGGTVRRACQACQRSKLKCDRNRPCERCIKRRIADACCADDGEDSLTSSPLIGAGAQHSWGPPKPLPHSHAQTVHAGASDVGEKRLAECGVPQKGGPSEGKMITTIVFSTSVSLEQRTAASSLIDLNNFVVRYNWDMGMSADLIASIFALLPMKLKNAVALSASWMSHLTSVGGEEVNTLSDLGSWDDVTTVGYARLTWDPATKLRQSMYANRHMGVVYGTEHSEFLANVADCSQGLSTTRQDWLIGFLEDTLCFLHGVRKYKRFFRSDSQQFPVLILEKNFVFDELGRPSSISQIWRQATRRDFENETAQPMFDGKLRRGDRLFAKEWEALPRFVPGMIGGADRVALLSLNEDLVRGVDGLVEEFCGLLTPFQCGQGQGSSAAAGNVGMQTGGHAPGDAQPSHEIQMQQHADQGGAWDSPHTSLDLFPGGLSVAGVGPPSGNFQPFQPDSMAFSRTQSDPGVFGFPHPTPQVFMPSFEPSGFSRTQSDPGSFGHQAFQRSEYDSGLFANTVEFQRPGSSSNAPQGQAARPLFAPQSFSPAVPPTEWQHPKESPQEPAPFAHQEDLGAEADPEASRPLSRAGSDPGHFHQEQHSPMHEDSGFSRTHSDPGFSRTHSDPGAFFSHPPPQPHGFSGGGGGGVQGVKAAPFQFGHSDITGGFTRAQSAPMEYNAYPAHLSTAETLEANPFSRSGSVHGEAAASHQLNDFAHIFAAHQHPVDNPFSRTQSEPGSGAFSRSQSLHEPTHDQFQEHSSSFAYAQPQLLQQPQSGQTGKRRNTLGGFQSQPFFFRTQSDPAGGFPFQPPGFGNQRDMDVKPMVNFGLMESSANKKRSSLEFCETAMVDGSGGGHANGHHAKDAYDDILTTDPVEQLAMTQKRNSDENIDNSRMSSMTSQAFDPLSTGDTGDTRKKCRKMWSGDWSPE